MIKGTEVELGGEVMIVPPLNLSALELFQDRLSSYQGGIDPESVKFVAEVAHAAIRRNYPDVTIEQLKDWIDLGNIGQVFNAVMNVSGLVRQGDGSGEAAAPAVA